MIKLETLRERRVFLTHQLFHDLNALGQAVIRLLGHVHDHCNLGTILQLQV